MNANRKFNPRKFQQLENDRLQQQMFQQQQMQVLQEMQIKEGLLMYSSIVQNCFKKCVKDFSKDELGKKEQSCIKGCAQKYINHSQRITQKFTENYNKFV